MPRLRPFGLALALLVASAGTSAAAPITYAFTGTVGPLPVSDPANVLLGQLVAGVTPVQRDLHDRLGGGGRRHRRGSGHLRVLRRGRLRGARRSFTFRSGENGITLTDDRPALPLPGSDPVDRLEVGSTAIDPLILPAFGYRVHTAIAVLSMHDDDEDAITLSEAVAPVPALGGFGTGSLGILGCGLGGFAGGACTSQLFEIGATIDGLTAIPEPATAALVALGVAGLGAVPRRLRRSA